MQLPKTCPKCKANLQGKPIPAHLQDDFGSTHFSRIIAFYDKDRDRTSLFKCPDCKHKWKREDE